MTPNQEQVEDEERYLNAAKEAWWANNSHRFEPPVKDDIIAVFGDGYNWRIREAAEMAASEPVTFDQEHVEELRLAAEALLDNRHPGFSLNSIADKIERVIAGAAIKTGEPVPAQTGEISIDPNMQVEVTRVGACTTVKISLDTRNPSLVEKK